MSSVPWHLAQFPGALGQRGRVCPLWGGVGRALSVTSDSRPCPFSVVPCALGRHLTNKGPRSLAERTLLAAHPAGSEGEDNPGRKEPRWGSGEGASELEAPGPGVSVFSVTTLGQQVLNVKASA